ncbi:hypothetical protein J6590_095281, partial [Homalodisca vitripennis]
LRDSYLPPTLLARPGRHLGGGGVSADAVLCCCAAIWPVSDAPRYISPGQYVTFYPPENRKTFLESHWGTA